MQPKFQPIWSPSQRGRWAAYPLLGLNPKNCAISRQTFHIHFFTSHCGWSILGIDFLRKFKVTVAPEINQIQFTCTAAASPALYLPSAALSASPYLFSFPLALAPVPIQLPAAATSSQPPAVSAHEVRNPELKSSSFSSRENQSLFNPPPPLFKKYLILCLLMSKPYCKNSPLFFEHHIHTGSHPPVFAKSPRLDPEKLQIAKAEFKRLESAGIIRRSKSPWASPLHMVPKIEGLWRPCGDYRLLNLVTTPDKYPLPNMQDLSNGLYGCTVFSKINLAKGYHQIPVATEDIPKAAIITPFGLFEYLFTPFGLSNATQLSKE